MGNKTLTPLACKACLVTDDNEKSPNALEPSGAGREGLLRRLVLGVDGPRARPRVRLHARVEQNPRSWPFFSSSGLRRRLRFALRFPFFFFFFSGTGSPAAANLFFSALRAALRSALALALAVVAVHGVFWRWRVALGGGVRWLVSCLGACCGALAGVALSAVSSWYALRLLSRRCGPIPPCDSNHHSVLRC